MTRRAFSVSLAGIVVSPAWVPCERSPVVILNAIAGAQLPRTLAITTTARGSFTVERIRKDLWELRTYRGVEPAVRGRLASIFPRAGIRPLVEETSVAELTYFIPFESLAARDRAWTLLNTDPEWIKARPRFQSYHFSLYLSL